MTTHVRPVVVGLGELLWDIFPDGKRPGGAPANVAFQASQLGCQGVLATRVGNDALGHELLAQLKDCQLDLSEVQMDPQAPTGTVTVELQDGHPSYVIHEEVAWDRLELTAGLTRLMQQAGAVCFGTLAQRHAISRTTIHQALAATRPDCLRVYDINLRQHYYAPDWIKDSLRLSGLFKLNHEEVEPVAGLLQCESDPVKFARTILEKHGPTVVCITRGAHGCLVVSHDEVHDIPGRAVKVADTVGAGDAFTAGFIVARLRGWALGLAGEFANCVGAMVAARQGAMPNLQREFSRLIEQYDPAI